MNPIFSTKTVDAKKKLTVHVSGKNLREGVRHNSRGCAIELAIEAKIPNSKALVNTGTVRILKPNGVIERYRNSSAGRKFIENFDNKKKVAPGDIELLPIPPKSYHSKATLAKRARRRRASGTDFRAKGGHRKLSLRTKLHNEAKAQAAKKAIFFIKD